MIKKINLQKFFLFLSVLSLNTVFAQTDVNSMLSSKDGVNFQQVTDIYADIGSTTSFYYRLNTNKFASVGSHNVKTLTPGFIETAGFNGSIFAPYVHLINSNSSAECFAVSPKATCSPINFFPNGIGFSNNTAGPNSTIAWKYTLTIPKKIALCGRSFIQAVQYKSGTGTKYNAVVRLKIKGSNCVFTANPFEAR